MMLRFAKAIGLWASLACLVGVVAHAQPQGDATGPWQLTVRADVQADLRALARAPELAVEATLETDRGSLGLGFSRDLAQTAAYEIELTETLTHRDWQVGAGLSWSYGNIPTANLTLGWRPDWGQAQLKLNAPPSPLNWELTGRYRGPNLKLNLHEVTGTLTTAAIHNATLRWSPDFTPATIRTRINRSQSPPFMLEGSVPLPGEAQFRMTHRLAPTENGWGWRSARLTARRDPLDASIDLNRDGWQALSASLERDLAEAWIGSAGVTVEPSGWRETEVGATWQPGLTNELAAELSLSPDGWSVSPSVNWRTDQPSTSVNGSLSLDPDGVGSARVTANAALGPFSLDGFYNLTGATWMLELSGNATPSPWHLNAAGSWLARLGFDEGSLQLGRDWSRPVPPLIP